MKLIYIIVLICIAAFSYYLGYKSNEYIPDYTEYESKIDSIQRILDSISIDTNSIRNAKLKLDTIYLNYEKDSIDMSKYSNDEHYMFFSEYIKRFDSINNNQPIKDIK